MKTLIYQYWDGDCNRPGVRAGVDAMKKYAYAIGADYIFEKNPGYAKSLGCNFGTYTPHYGAFKPILQEWDYDKILFADTDVFPVEGLNENIFNLETLDIAICREQWQTLHKPDRNIDQRWATHVETEFSVKIPRDERGNVIIYNSGVVLYSKESFKKIKKEFVSFGDYVNSVKDKFPAFYTCDQFYLHAMMQKVNWSELDQDWNRYVHYLPNTKDPRPVNDTRTPTTKFVHIQLRCADDWDAEKLWRITNLPEKDWKL